MGELNSIGGIEGGRKGARPVTGNSLHSKRHMLLLKPTPPTREVPVVDPRRFFRLLSRKETVMQHLTCSIGECGIMKGHYTIQEINTLTQPQTVPNLIRQLCLCTTRKIGVSPSAEERSLISCIRSTSSCLVARFFCGLAECDGSTSVTPSCGHGLRNRQPLEDHLFE